MSWEEKIEGIRYTIEIPIQSTDFISELYLTEWNEHSAWRYRIMFEGDRLRVMWSRKANMFEAFKPICELIYDSSFEEWPWFIDPEELVDAVEKLGVKKTYDLILDYIKTLFLEPFKEEVE